MSYLSELSKLKSFVLSLSNLTRIDDVRTNKIMLQHFSELSEIISNNTVNEKLLIANENLLIFEDIINNKKINLNRLLIASIIQIFQELMKIIPGYAVRNILNSYLTLCNNYKTLSRPSQECVVLICGDILFTRSKDCGNQINEMVQTCTKLIKVNDTILRISVLKSIEKVVVGCGCRIGDLHNEILKLVTKLNGDKSAEIRYLIAKIIIGITKNSLGCTTLPVELLMNATIKGLEDGVALVQEIYAIGLGTIFIEQINTYSINQEQAKFGAARGVDSPNSINKQKSSVQSTRISMTSRMSMTRTKTVEEYDLKSVINRIIQQITKSLPLLRAGYIAALGYLIKVCLTDLSQDEVEWLGITIVGILKDPLIVALNYEETAFLRSRISHLIRSTFVTQLPEVKLISFASFMIRHVSSIESRTEQELQIVLSEVSQIITVLGEAAVSLVDEVNATATIHLRHSSFSVRSAAANALSNISMVAPVVAVDILRNALTNTRTQASYLMSIDEAEMSSFDAILDESIATANVLTDTNPPQAVKKRNPKENERLQRMYYFHGNTLVISLILKNASLLPTGLPMPIISEMYDLGIELLQQDILSSPLQIRHISCSIVRAGSLIVSSCFNLGYQVAKLRLKSLLQCCDKIFKSSNNDSLSPHVNNNLSTESTAASTSNPGQQPQLSTADNELIYEIMGIEAALVCISSLLLFSPEALTIEENCLSLIVEGLDTSFRALKGKYQPKVRSHFRFRTLHVILLECYSWLPHGSFPNTCQQIFVETLRVFRDSITSGCENTCLAEYIPLDKNVLRIGGLSSFSLTNNNAMYGIDTLEIMISDNILMLKLENYSTALLKKESEAFLTAFNKDNYPCVKYNHFHRHDGSFNNAQAPCGQIDSRTVNAAILLLAATFPYQTAEYQDKAIQLCSQAITQFSKGTNKSSLGIFSSDDEKRRKDRRNLLTTRNVIAALSSIVCSYPIHTGLSIDPDASWRQSIIDIFYDSLAHQTFSLKCSSALGLSTFVNKLGVPVVVQSICSKVRSLIISTFEKKTNDNMTDYSGYLIALSSLWKSASSIPDVKSLIMTTVFDCLRKPEYSIIFRSYTILALSLIVEDMYHEPDVENVILINQLGQGDAHDILEKIQHIIEINIANVATSDDMETFIGCLIKLINITIAYSLKASREPYHNLNGNVINATKQVTNKLFRMSKQLLNVVSNQYISNEAVFLIHYLVEHEEYHEFVLIQFKNVVENKHLYSWKGLKSIVSAISILCKTIPEKICQLGLHSALYELLDYCIASSAISHDSISPFSGIEIRRGVLQEDLQSQELTKLVESITESILVLVETDVRWNPDVRIGYWIQYSRAIALNISSKVKKTKTNSTATNENDVEEDVDQEGDESNTQDAVVKSNSNKADNSINANAGDIGNVTYDNYLSHYRELVFIDLPDLKYSRTQIKALAIKSIIIALKWRSNHQGNIDIQYARQVTNEFITSLGPLTEEKLLSHCSCSSAIPPNNTWKGVSIPNFISLNLNDLINISCACATFTIEDKSILLLQKESMELLHLLVVLFENTVDPDTISSANTGAISTQNEKILQQYLSQLLSAARVCLAVSWDHGLLNATGLIVIRLIKTGLINDKVMMRRLIKPLITFSDIENDVNPSTSSIYSLTVRAKQSPLVCEDISVCTHVANMALLGHLYTLALPSISNSDVNESIKSSLLSIMQEYLPKLTQIWESIIIDIIRIHYTSINNNQHNISLMSRSEIVKLQNHQMEINPLRGGLVYNSCSNPNNFSQLFLEILPVIMLSYVSSCKTIRNEINDNICLSFIGVCYLRLSVLFNEQTINNETSLPTTSSSGDYIIHSLHLISLQTVDISKKYLILNCVLDSLKEWICLNEISYFGENTISSVIDMMINAWKNVALTIPDTMQWRYPAQLTLLLLTATNPEQIKNSSFIPRLIIQSILKSIQLSNNSNNHNHNLQVLLGGYLAEYLLCVVLVLLVHPMVHSDLQVLSVKAIFVLFNFATTETQRDKIVSLIIHPLCVSIIKQNQGNGTMQEYMLLCGKGLTHIARLASTEFRNQISGLNEGNRNILQQSMLLAMQQQSVNNGDQLSTPAENNPASNNSGGMKLNLSKYKK
eukprot:gene7657-10420_t